MLTPVSNSIACLGVILVLEGVSYCRDGLGLLGWAMGVAGTTWPLTGCKAGERKSQRHALLRLAWTAGNGPATEGAHLCRVPVLLPPRPKHPRGRANIPLVAVPAKTARFSSFASIAPFPERYILITSDRGSAERSSRALRNSTGI